MLTVVALFAGACKKKSPSGTSVHDAAGAGAAKVEESAPIAAPAPAAPTLAPPAAGTVRLTHDRLILDLKGSWRSAIDGGMLAASLEGVADAAVLVMPTIDLGGGSLADVLVRGIDASTQGRTLVKALPAQPELGTTRAGVAFVSQFRQTRGAAGDVMNALYYLYDVGGRGQLVVALATSTPSFKLVATAVVAKETQVIAAPTAPSVGVPTGAGSTSYTTAVGSTAYVASVGESPKLAPVPFQLTWAQYNPRASAMTSFGFHFTRDGRGNAYVYDSREYDAVRTDAVSTYAGGGSKRALTAIDHTAFEAAVLGATGFRDASGSALRTSEFESLDADLGGNLFVGGRAAIFGDAFKGYTSYFVWRGGTGKAEPILPKLTFEQPFNWQATSVLRPTPQGDAWLFIPRAGSWPRVLYLRHSGGAWSLQEIDVSRFAGGGKGPTPTIEALTTWGAPDFTGGWVFYSNGAFWRISRDGGAIAPLLRMDLPTKGVSVSGPIVLANGDIWFAALEDSSVVSYVGPDQWGHGTAEVKHQSIVLGDRSRWIRARLDGKGGVSLGEIDGEAILAALRKAGARLDGGVFQTPRLKVDLTSGGILTYDTHHGVLYALAPQD